MDMGILLSVRTWLKKYPEIAAFLLVFLFQLYWNSKVIIMRSLPDEMGAMSFAAYISGRNWNAVLSNPSMFYGNGSFFLLYPFFSLIKDPLILYQHLIGVGAFLRSIPAIISIFLAKRYFSSVNGYWVYVLIGIGSCLFTPTRATNIDNEPMLILLVWLTVLLIFQLMTTENLNKKKFFSLLLAFLFSYAYFSHTRGVIFLIAFILVAVLYNIFEKKPLINYKWFIFFTVCFFLIVNFVNNELKQLLFISMNPSGEANTLSALSTGILSNIKQLISFTGIRSFFDLLASNIWVINVFSFGIIPLIFFGIIFKFFKNKRKIEWNYYPLLFCIFGMLIGLFGVCIFYLHNGLSVHVDDGNINRFHFYLRYYGNFFDPIFLYFSYIGFRNKRCLFSSYIMSALLWGIVCLYTYFSVIKVTIVERGYHILTDWFYYFAPFSGVFMDWPNIPQGRKYFLVSTIVSFCLFSLICLLLYFRKRKIMLFICVVVMAWYYGYSVHYFDSPFSKSYNYYQSVDKIYSLEKNDPDFLKNEKVAYINPGSGPQYLMQFILRDQNVNWFKEYDSHLEDDYNIFISNYKIENINDYKEYCLDDNEYIYVKEK